MYEMEGEKTEKYLYLKREIGRLWRIRHLEVIPVIVGALGVVSKGWIHGLRSQNETIAENSLVGRS